MRLPFQKRDASDASDALTTALLAVASGTDGNPRRTALVRSCAGLVSRSLSRCVPTPAHNAVMPELLAALGYELVVTGEAVRLIDGALLWEVEDLERGSRPDGTLMYRLRRKRPGQLQQSQKETHSAAAVIDVRNPAAVDRTSPSFAALAAVEKLIEADARAPHGQLMLGGAGAASPLGSKAAVRLVAAVGRTLRERPGELVPIPGAHTAPGNPVQRVGLDPTAELVQLRTALETSCASALGVPPALVVGSVGGGAQREAHRYFTRSTVDPLARLIEAQLRKLVPGLTLNTAPVGGKDVVAMARALKVLVEIEGVSLSEAKALVGVA